MYFGHNSKHLQNSPHLTRWVAPTPQYTPSIMLIPPINVSINKVKKWSKFHMYLSLSSILQTPRQTHRCTNLHDGSPRHSTTFYSTNFHPQSPTQLEATLILSNFGHHPLPNLKCTPGHSCISYNRHTPLHTGV